MSADYRLVANPAYGFLQVAPTPSAEEISRYYADEFYSNEYTRLNDSSLEVQTTDREFYDGHRGDMCHHLETLLDQPLKGASVLDVGCGWGQALDFFKSRGMECFGFDPAPEAVEHARERGLNVIEASVDRMDAFYPKRFDVVTLLNVLEHLADPIGVVAAIRDDVLRPGGVLVIDVPNEFNAFQLCGQAAHDLGQWWVAPPAHLNYFSASTLRSMLEGQKYEVPIVEASFPMELFLLCGLDYVTDQSLGRTCHQQRMAFEANLRRCGRVDVLRDLYSYLASRDLGRQVMAFARRSG